MKVLAFVLTVAGLLFSVGASAMHCPQDMAKIDAALAKQPTLSKDKPPR